MGGWNTPAVLEKHYIESTYLLPEPVVGLYSWLASADPLVRTEQMQHVGQPAPEGAGEPMDVVDMGQSVADEEPDSPSTRVSKRVRVARDLADFY